jgi:hypothetical protein
MREPLDLELEYLLDALLVLRYLLFDLREDLFGLQHLFLDVLLERLTLLLGRRAHLHLLGDNQHPLLVHLDHHLDLRLHLLHRLLHLVLYLLGRLHHLHGHRHQLLCALQDVCRLPRREFIGGRLPKLNLHELAPSHLILVMPGDTRVGDLRFDMGLLLG